MLKDLGNYSGDRRILKRAFLRRMVDDHLAEELGRFPNAWIVPFGSTALLVLEHLVAAGVVDPARVLGGILHPGGQQWNRYKVQLGLVDGAEAAVVPGGKEVRRRSEALRAQVRGILSRPRIN